MRAIRHERAVWLAAAGLVAGAAVGATLTSGGAPVPKDVEGSDEVALLADQSTRPSVEAYFTRESYRPGEVARLVVWTQTPRATLTLLRAAAVEVGGIRLDEMRGEPVTSSRTVPVRGGAVSIRIGDWPSGVYYAELRARGLVGYAPFVLRPRALGAHRVAVVMPTLTWQAYNRRDVDGNGDADTWYGNWSIRWVSMARPFLDRGVPPRFNRYDLPFLRWLVLEGHDVDYLSDRDLDAASGAALARAYTLIVFPGHHEYVTGREFHAVHRYRDLGGNLMFLSANNFFYDIVRRGDLITRTEHWRHMGHPESAIVGVQYVASDRGQHRGSFRITGAPATEWVFGGTGLGPGDVLQGSFGIEIDARTAASPEGLQVLATIPNLLGRHTAEMTYYETPRGAKVFAAGAFTMGGAALAPAVSRVLANLWSRLASA